MNRACALCGHAAPAPFRAPAPESAPDLDHRPGEPARSTLARWIQTCRGCGACAPDLTLLPPGARTITQTAAYGQETSPFLRWAMLVEGTDAHAEALLHAAWEADDAGDDGMALRRRAASVWPVGSVDSELRLAEILRRAGAFAEAAARLDALPGHLDETSEQIVAFQRARIAAADAGRHLISSALRPPARMPHVAHGKAAKPGGFWSRLRRG